MNRRVKLNRIGQAHLAPGMSLLQWQALLAKHGIGRTWHGVSNQVIDALIADITDLIRQGPGLAPPGPPPFNGEPSPCPAARPRPLADK